MQAADLQHGYALPQGVEIYDLQQRKLSVTPHAGNLARSPTIARVDALLARLGRDMEAQVKGNYNQRWWTDAFNNGLNGIAANEEGILRASVNGAKVGAGIGAAFGAAGGGIPGALVGAVDGALVGFNVGFYGSTAAHFGLNFGQRADQRIVAIDQAIQAAAQAGADRVAELVRAIGVELYANRDLPNDLFDNTARFVRNGVWIHDPVAVHLPAGLVRIYPRASVITGQGNHIVAGIADEELWPGAELFEVPGVQIASRCLEARITGQVLARLQAAGMEIGGIPGWFRANGGERMVALQTMVRHRLTELGGESALIRAAQPEEALFNEVEGPVDDPLKPWAQRLIAADMSTQHVAGGHQLPHMALVA